MQNKDTLPPPSPPPSPYIRVWDEEAENFCTPEQLKKRKEKRLRKRSPHQT